MAMGEFQNLVNNLTNYKERIMVMMITMKVWSKVSNIHSKWLCSKQIRIPEIDIFQKTMMIIMLEWHPSFLM